MVERQPRLKTGLDKVEQWRLNAEKFLAQTKTVSDCVSVLTDSKEGPRTRAFALVAAMVYAARGREALFKMVRRKYDFAATVPINPELYEFHEEPIGIGYWSEVYKLTPKQEGLPTWVYKVEFPAAHTPSDDLLDVIEGHQTDYRELRQAYAALPKLIPETHYLIVESPRTKQPAIAALQSYAGDEAFDLIDPANSSLVERLLAGDEAFKKEFEAFREITLSLQDKLEAPDLAGKSNVLVVKDGETHTLRLVDQHRLHRENEVAQRSQLIAIEQLKRLGIT